MRKNFIEKTTLKDRKNQKKKTEYENSPEGKLMRAIFGDYVFNKF